MPVPAGRATPVLARSINDKYTKALYNFSLSHKFTDDLMVYATTGTLFRSGLPAINNLGLAANLVTPAPEGANILRTWHQVEALAVDLRVNAAVFQLDYKDQLTTFEGVQYFNHRERRTATDISLAFYRNLMHGSAASSLRSQRSRWIICHLAQT